MPKRTNFQIRSDAARQRWHVRDEKKESFWRGHKERCRKSGLSKRAYCTKHNLAYSSFMTWRREIEIRDRESVPPASVSALLATAEKSSNPFVPIRVLSEASLPAQESPVRENNASQSSQVEISLPGGTVIRIQDNCNPSFVAKLLAALGTLRSGA